MTVDPALVLNSFIFTKNNNLLMKILLSNVPILIVKLMKVN